MRWTALRRRNCPTSSVTASPCHLPLIGEGISCVSHLIEELFDEVECVADQGGVLGVAAEVEVGAGGVEGVELGELVAQLQQVGLEELRHEAAEYDVAVEREANVVDADGKMAQIIVQQRPVGAVAALDAEEKFPQRHAGDLRQPCGGAIGLQTAAAAAFARQPAGLNAHVAEFAAAAVVAGELRAVDQHRAAHAVLNGQKGDISRAG